MTPHPRVPLVLVSGLAADPDDELAELLRRAGPGVAVVHHDLRQIGSGVVRRRIRLGAREELTALELAHGCVNCTLREDLLPLLRRLARRPDVDRIVVRLDEAMEPEPVSWAIANVLVGDRPVSDDVGIEAVYTVVDCATWLADASGDELLLERGLQGSPEDERTVAQVALAQVEFADVLVLAGAAPDAWCAAKSAAVLDRVAPSVPRVELSRTDAAALLAAVPERARRGEVTDLHGALLRGQPPLHAECGIEVLTFTAQRPFHPERLHEAIDTLLGGVVRTRGRVWVASRPDVAFWLESAGGGLALGHAGPWLASPHGPDWADVSPERRTLASLRWHEVWGDRAQELVVVTDLAAPRDLEDALRGALLTDEELADGEAAWRSYPDPFGERHEDPCDATEEQDRHVSAANRKDEPQ
ncbi:ribosome hibernation factor-recruiting GTPase MRF [Amycolatopsis sp. FDAARGOS 1241]|uniref:ribosome hibernation factor-recruiting GTPase MRF n=1 Tax=Amycolatopsis sp. FDAARGOS 1241 TaxID=2778070 RepID=UPI00195190D4|nr:GTP-binding protein [Amycolatopsis sp. FDAARGOS 1241]QRP49619.1 GTP-binding protein [Amycolatopsis sp. FDAARGOS 1241]